MNYYVYILTNQNNTVLYIGITNNLERRINEHKSGEIEGFSRRYQTYKLVYYEQTPNVDFAINREKQLKGWSRKKKELLINSLNPSWKDLSDE